MARSGCVFEDSWAVMEDIFEVSPFVGRGIKVGCICGSL